MLDWIAALVGVFTITTTLLPFSRTAHWWIRIWDFPRIQLAAIGVGALVLHLSSDGRLPALNHLLTVVLVACVALHLARIFPYTILASKESADATPDAPEQNKLHLVLSNVLMSNRDFSRTVEMLRRQDPDVFLVVETDQAWLDALSDTLGDDYPHTVLVPQDNTYGMGLFSRFPLHGAEILFLTETDVPSIATDIELPCGHEITCRFLHPRPPRFQQDTTNRDAELLTVGKELADHTSPCLVAGDLNDVAWSHTTRLFRRTSHLLDPRIGRGLFSTFSARSSLVRFPLDHLFHSQHLTLDRIERLPPTGSDHFPIAIKLCLESSAPARQEVPTEEGDDLEEVAEKISPAVGRGGAP
ncbi:endonuclease/exonuclease/phosphatase family protein [soil metagenome]